MPSIRVEESIDIRRGIDAVFDEITDPRTWVRGESGLRFHGAGDLREGAQMRAELERGGKVHTSEVTVTAYERPRRFGMRALGEPMNFVGLVELTGDDERTRLTAAIELEPSRRIFGLGIGLGGRFLKREIAKVVQQKLSELKAELERTA